MDLQSLRLYVQPEVFGDRFSVPFHERSVDFEDLVAIHANHLGLEVLRPTIDGVELGFVSHVDFPDDPALVKQGETPVDGGPGDRLVELARPVEEILGSEMVR